MIIQWKFQIEIQFNIYVSDYGLVDSLSYEVW